MDLAKDNGDFMEYHGDLSIYLSMINVTDVFFFNVCFRDLTGLFFLQRYGGCRECPHRREHLEFSGLFNVNDGWH